MPSIRSNKRIPIRSAAAPYSKSQKVRTQPQPCIIECEILALKELFDQLKIEANDDTDTIITISSDSSLEQISSLTDYGSKISGQYDACDLESSVEYQGHSNAKIDSINTEEILESEAEMSNSDCSESDYDTDYSIEAPPDLDSTRESSNDSFFISNQF